MITTLLEIAGGIVGYVLVGLLWARSQAVRLQRLIKRAQAHRAATHERKAKRRTDWDAKEDRRQRPSSYRDYYRSPNWYEDQKDDAHLGDADPRFAKDADGAWDEALRKALGRRAAFWPGFLLERLGDITLDGLIRIARDMCDWTTKPVEEERERVRKLREDINDYRAAAEGVDGEERDWIDALIDTLTQQANKKDL